ncbi:MAG TPA: PorV/PorQ family protein [bacterium]|nr:PorV/PorQ family protein [bacterium]HPR87184.1 PorV/PorQ family protein [bacterium]
MRYHSSASIKWVRRTGRFGLLLGVLAAAAATPAAAQDNKGIGLHGAPFLRVSAIARAVGLGEAYSVFGGGEITGLRYNPAAPGLMAKPQLAFNLHNWIDDTRQGGIAAALPTKLGVFSADLGYFDEGEIIELDENFQQTGGSTTSNDMLLTLGYAKSFKVKASQLSLGAAFKVLHQDLIGERSTASGADIGLHFIYRFFGVAAAVQNIGISKISFADQSLSLPQTYRGGVALRLPLSQDFRLNLAADAASTVDEKLRYYTGGELVISDLIALRGGYKIHDVEASRWSAGLGLNMPAEWLGRSRLRFDYAYAPLDEFEDAAHRFSVLIRFGETEPGMNAMMAADRSAADDLLQEQLDAAEKSRKAAAEAEKRARAMEEEIAERLARIKKIAAESEGKIEVEPKTREKILVSMRINFDFDQARIRPEEFATMHKVADILNTYPEAKVQLSGHTDYIGTEVYNIRLSQRRIDSVMVFLINKEKVSRVRFFMPVGYGESKPIATNETPAGRFRNRRVEFLLYTMDTVPEIPEGTAIKSIEVVDDQTVRIICNGKVSFKTDQLDNPSRLVIDFPKVYLLNDISSYELNHGPFVRARLGYHDEGFSRVVFDLNRTLDLKVTGQDNFVIISTK